VRIVKRKPGFVKKPGFLVCERLILVGRFDFGFVGGFHCRDGIIAGPGYGLFHFLNVNLLALGGFEAGFLGGDVHLDRTGIYTR
jgi:hypothetical protein